jgi:hypothetical protein
MTEDELQSFAELLYKQAADEAAGGRPNGDVDAPDIGGERNLMEAGYSPGGALPESVRVGHYCRSSRRQSRLESTARCWWHLMDGISWFTITLLVIPGRSPLVHGLHQIRR